ncbi:MAG: hypothetical protein LUE92_11995 [Clostridiales bacterium]|nr:hypothetical protein [Clostridiales bacterium]
MAKLAYKTRGNSSPQGKERVFFTCHPKDMEPYFDAVCGEIFKTQNCVIWYDCDPGNSWTAEDLELELSRVQLFVIPVTARFLYEKNSAHEILFRFAMEHHIPVLPLMQESGLESDFNRNCGECGLAGGDGEAFADV